VTLFLTLKFWTSDVATRCSHFSIYCLLPPHSLLLITSSPRCCCIFQPCPPRSVAPRGLFLFLSDCFFGRRLFPDFPFDPPPRTFFLFYVSKKGTLSLHPSLFPLCTLSPPCFPINEGHFTILSGSIPSSNPAESTEDLISPSSLECEFFGSPPPALVATSLFPE